MSADEHDDERDLDVTPPLVSKDEHKTRVRIKGERSANMSEIPPSVRTVRAMRNRRRVIE